MPQLNSNQREAEECAALAMLHCLQTRHTALFNGNQRAEGNGLTNEGDSQVSGHKPILGTVEVLHPGYGERRPIPLGHKVKVRTTPPWGQGLRPEKWGVAPWLDIKFYKVILWGIVVRKVLCERHSRKAPRDQ